MKRKLAAVVASAIALAVGLAASPGAAQFVLPPGHGGGGHFAPHGFGGGAAHFGGGGFGGGGPHFAPHGFGGGGMHFGPRAFGGGPVHFGAAPGFGHFAPRAFGGAGVGHFAPRAFAPGGFARFGAGRYGLGGAGRYAGVGAAAALGGAAYGYHHGWSGWRDWRRGAIGWGGPVFWPYAYDDVFGYAFLPYEPEDDLFWSYGYDDLFAGILLPFVAAAAGGGYGAGGYASAPAAAPPAAGGAPASVGQLCASAQSLAGGAAIDRIASAVHPTPDQNAKLQALKTAEADAEKPLAASCSQQAPTTAVARLDAVATRLQAMIQAANAVGGPLNDFYASLSDEQKAEFNALGETKAGAPPSLAAVCGPNNAVPTIAVDRIEGAVKPDDKQRQALNALRDAANKADDAILASCPKTAPLTPTARLDAVKGRLNAMLDGVNTVKQPLQDFYASLNDVQKSRFDSLA